MTTHPVPAYRLTEIDPHTFMAEASELLLPPGKWPSRLEVTDQPIGNGNRFLYFGSDEEALWYKQEMGHLVIKILND